MNLNIVLCGTVSLFLMTTVFPASAEPSGQVSGTETGNVRYQIEPVLIGHGFALNGDEYHIVDVDVLKTNDIPPDFIRTLLIGKKTPEEITNEINGMQSETKTMAHIRFAGQAYSISIISYDNQSLTGDVLKLPSGTTYISNFTPAVIGHISLSMSKYEGDMLSTGTISMNNTDYRLLLTSPTILKR